MIHTEMQQILEPLVASLGYILWGCEYLPQGRYSLLRVYIDKETGISIDDCEKVSKEVSALLDVEDPIAGQYSLEVSSPGIPRPLFSREHYVDYIGHQVFLKLRQAIQGSKKLSGTIVSVDKNHVEISVGDNTINIEFSQIQKANLIGE